MEEEVKRSRPSLTSIYSPVGMLILLLLCSITSTLSTQVVFPRFDHTHLQFYHNSHCTGVSRELMYVWLTIGRTLHSNSVDTTRIPGYYSILTNI